MTDTWPCGHPDTPENTRRSNHGKLRCRQCHVEACRDYRRIKAGKAPLRAPKIVIEPERLSAEAYGSRRLLEGYAAYFERHVAPTA